ncbi:MAG TPA: class II aldolase/adducin family protein [Xanthobacteraceae bacterium]|nr:class II aldolase/adducin family protein [Xanthobacteraceae bacterium]
MTKLEAAIDELVTANRILAREGVVDSFGHPSIRHPDRPDRFLLSRARAPDLIEAEDIMEFTFNGDPVEGGDKKPYLERFIHAAIYDARPEVNAVIHNHSPSVLPFSVTKKSRLRPLHHVCACMGHEVPTWDSQTEFGDTSLLVATLEMGRDLAKFLGPKPAALMRGHGCVVVGKDIREAVYIACYLELAAKLQMQAMDLGEVTYLTPGEVDLIIRRTGPYSFNRAWENWCRRAGRVMLERPDEVVRLMS